MCNPNVNWLEKGRALLVEMCYNEETFSSLDFKLRLRSQTNERVYQEDVGQFLRHNFVTGEMPGYDRRPMTTDQGVEYLEYFLVDYDQYDGPVNVDDYGLEDHPDWKSSDNFYDEDKAPTTLRGLWSQLRRKLGV